jgi:hypothetical protein
MRFVIGFGVGVGVLFAAGCGGGEVSEDEFAERFRTGVCTWVEACAATAFTGYYEDAADCEANLVTEATTTCTFDPEQAEACLDLLEGADCEAEEWVPDGATCSSSYVCST